MPKGIDVEVQKEQTATILHPSTVQDNWYQPVYQKAGHVVYVCGKYSLAIFGSVGAYILVQTYAPGPLGSLYSYLYPSSSVLGQFRSQVASAAFLPCASGFGMMGGWEGGKIVWQGTVTVSRWTYDHTIGAIVQWAFPAKNKKEKEEEQTEQSAEQNVETESDELFNRYPLVELRTQSCPSTPRRDIMDEQCLGDTSSTLQLYRHRRRHSDGDLLVFKKMQAIVEKPPCYPRCATP